MPVSEAQKRAMAKYNLKTVQYIFRFRTEDDADVIAKLKSEPNRTAFLRELVRRDIREHQNT